MLDQIFPFLGYALILMILIFSFVYIVHLPLKNAGIVDVAWGAAIALAGILFYLLGERTDKSLLMTIMVSVWGFRLTYHLLMRNIIDHKEEDGRYQILRKEWAKNLQLKFYLFFNAQGLLNVVLSIPFLMVAINPDPEVGVFEIAGFIIWVIALLGESLADYQLKQFKKDMSNKGKVCDTGLWNYSRHPNYFFEWLNWIAYFVFALGSPLGWISIICPALMLHFLLRVTGIPLTEEQSIKSKGDAYRNYQKTTSAFIPWKKLTTKTN